VVDIPPKRRRRPAAPGAVPFEVNLDDIQTPPEPEIPKANKRTKEDPESPGKPHQTIERKLTNFFVGMALPFAAAGDQHCANLLATRGPVVAEAWANLANESPAVKAALESMLKGGAWAGTISTTLTLIVPIAVHHGMPIPDFVSPVIFGLTPKEKKKDESEDFVAERVPPEPKPASNAGNGGAPGPAAVSVLRHDTGAADPTNYPQTGNAEQFSKRR